MKPRLGTWECAQSSSYFIRDALLEFNGGGRRSLQGARDRGELETSFRTAYGKLARSPIPASTALLAECTACLWMERING